MQFRLKGKRFHLTYAQCDLDPNDLYLHIKSIALDNANELVRLRIANERHADGTPHRHLTVEFSRAWDRRGDNAERLFDFGGFHPSIKPKRTVTEWKNAVAYLEKEEEWADFVGHGHGFEGTTDNTSLIDKAQEATSYLDYLRFVEHEKRNPTLAKLVWDAVANREPSDRTIRDEDLSDGLIERITAPQLRDQEYPATDDNHGVGGPQSVIVQGPTSVGKTTWALIHAPKPALWVRHADDLQFFRSHIHKSLILDDMDVKHTPRTNQLNWVDRRGPVSVHVRYRVARIPAGVHRVFTCNEGDWNLPVTLAGDDAMTARVMIINCTE